MVISLATGHSELGGCNSDELYKIIEHIARDTIFEEVPPAKFGSLYNGLLKDSLETHTIKRYLQNHPTANCLVDLDTDARTDPSFKKNISMMFNTFEVHSAEYSDLSNQHTLKVEQHGFPYLNSNQCSEILERKHLLEKMMLANSNHAELSETHKKWLGFIESRRIGMIKNIYQYAAHIKFKTALFLLGAEHRKPIIYKISEFEKSNNCKLIWNDNYFNL